MRLRTLVGSRAGQIQDYSFTAGCAALRTGMAERDPDYPVQPIPGERADDAPVRRVPQPTRKPKARR